MRWLVFIIIAIVMSGVVSAQETTSEPAPPTLDVPPTVVPLPTESFTATPDTRRWVLDESGEVIGAVDLVMGADTSFSVIIQLVQTLILLVWFLIWLGRERK